MKKSLSLRSVVWNHCSLVRDRHFLVQTLLREKDFSSLRHPTPLRPAFFLNFIYPCAFYFLLKPGDQDFRQRDWQMAAWFSTGSQPKALILPFLTQHLRVWLDTCQHAPEGRRWTKVTRMETDRMLRYKPLRLHEGNRFHMVNLPHGKRTVLTHQKYETFKNHCTIELLISIRWFQMILDLLRNSCRWCFEEYCWATWRLLGLSSIIFWRDQCGEMWKAIEHAIERGSSSSKSIRVYLSSRKPS